MPAEAKVELLSCARTVAEYAASLGINQTMRPARISLQRHIGAALADAVLQAGLNYRTVVKHRVERIVVHFPQAATLPGTLEIVRNERVPEFLMWKHEEKIGRFARLAYFLDKQNVEDTNGLRDWLQLASSRAGLLEITGIGPKTVDYLCCLVGIDCVAVDRHLRTFAMRAGVVLQDYDCLRLTISYAADLLGVRRRDFDSWIWNFLSLRLQVSSSDQFELITECESQPLPN